MMPPENKIPRALLPVAVALQLGTSVSLASLVTANLYSDLNYIVQMALQSKSKEYLRVYSREDASIDMVTNAWISCPSCSLWQAIPKDNITMGEIGITVIDGSDADRIRLRP
ncbi:hypothetical protein CsSME_00021501 [Camellia sinensis var. sinensis]